MILQGSYANGFAPRDGMPSFPSLWQNCMAAWAPCLGPTGARLFDSSPYKRHAAATASPTFEVIGGKYCSTYNGTTQYHTASIGTLTQPFTESFWAYRTSYGSASHAAVGISGSGGSVSVIYPYDTNGGNGVRWFFGANLVDQNSGAVSPGWNHYCAVSRSATDHQFYVNGVSIGTSTTSATLGTALTVEIGTFAAAQFFPGSLDDVRIYSRALLPNEITLLASRRGIAFEMLRKRRLGSGIAFNRRRRLLVGAGT